MHGEKGCKIMVVVMKPGTRQQDIDALVSKLKELDLSLIHI